MQESIFNSKSKVTWIIVIIIIFGLICLNLVFNEFKPRIEKLLSNVVGRQVSIGRIFIFDPSRIVVTDLEVSKISNKGERKKIFFPKAVITFSFYKMIIEKRIVLSKLYLDKPELYDKGEVEYLSNKFKRGSSLLNTLKWQDFDLSIVDGKILQRDESGLLSDDVVSINLEFSNQLGIIDVFGDISACSEGEDTENIPVEFIASIAAENEGLVLNKVDFRQEGVYFLSLNGHTNMNKVFVKGYALVEEKSKLDIEPVIESKLDPFEVLNRMFLKIGKKEFKDISASGLNILDIDGVMSIKEKSLNLERIDCVINNMPTRIKGQISFINNMHYDLEAVTFLSNSKKGLNKVFDKISSKLKGFVHRRIINVDGSVELDLRRGKSGYDYAEKIGFVISEMLLDYRNTENFKITSNSIDLFVDRGKNHQSVLLENIQSDFKNSVEQGNYFNFNSEIFGGEFIVSALAASNRNIKNKYSLIIKNIEIGKIEGLEYDFSSLKGELNANVEVAEKPEMSVDGYLSIKDGYMVNAPFLSWLSEYFDIPSVKSIEDYNVGLSFRLNNDSMEFIDVQVDSKKLSLDGYFKLRDYSKVSSEFSLGFDRDLLKESKRFRSLLKRIKDDRDRVSFDFRLLGDKSNISFQWMQSDFKEAASGVIPKFIKKKIEKNIQKAIE